MAVPKSKVSRQRRDKRRSSVWKLEAPAIVKCPNCGASCATDAHFCSRCGMVLHEETSVVVPEEVQQSEVPEQEAPSEPEKQDEEPLIEEKL